MREHDCPWDWVITACAAEVGNLEVLRWVREHHSSCGRGSTTARGTRRRGVLSRAQSRGGRFGPVALLVAPGKSSPTPPFIPHSNAPNAHVSLMYICFWLLGAAPRSQQGYTRRSRHGHTGRSKIRPAPVSPGLVSGEGGRIAGLLNGEEAHDNTVRSHIGSLNGAPRVAEAPEVGARYHVPVTADLQAAATGVQVTVDAAGVPSWGSCRVRGGSGGVKTFTPVQ